MHVAVNLRDLDVAEELLEKAQSLEPHSRSIKHSLAEVDLKRSRLTSYSLERQAWRRSAIERATALGRRDSLEAQGGLRSAPDVCSWHIAEAFLFWTNSATRR
jgi:hypothetical protein